MIITKNNENVNFRLEELLSSERHQHQRIVLANDRKTFYNLFDSHFFSRDDYVDISNQLTSDETLVIWNRNWILKFNQLVNDFDLPKLISLTFIRLQTAVGGQQSTRKNSNSSMIKNFLWIMIILWYVNRIFNYRILFNLLQIWKRSCHG